MRKVVAAVLAALFVVPNIATSGDCRRVAHVPAYVAPVHVGHGYANFHHQQVVIVPKAIQVIKALDSYSSVGDEYRQAYFAKLVAEEYAKIVELSKQHQAATGPAPTGPAPKEAIAAPKQELRVAVILKDRCASCHSSGKQAPDLSGDPDKIDETTRLRAFLAVAQGKMPKGKPSLPQEEFNLLAEWAEGGKVQAKK